MEHGAVTAHEKTLSYSDQNAPTSQTHVMVVWPCFACMQMKNIGTSRGNRRIGRHLNNPPARLRNSPIAPKPNSLTKPIAPIAEYPDS